MPLPELLAPAGSFEALCAAVSAGADAVYAGGRMLNARMNAKNLDDGALKEAVAVCHENGAKLYITLNTLVLDREMDSAVSYAAQLDEAGVDAVIITDAGLIRRVRERCPGLILHGSTQMSGHDHAAAEQMYRMGLSRMVCAREMTAGDIRAAAAVSPIGLEIFVHGALCVCASGQCLASSLIGGRSGNRGECAQPCRLPYNGGYPLSLRDLCLAGRMKEVISTGAVSLKIEGRMKSPAYVSGVTSVYRALLDERRDATAEERKALASLFSRGGFTDGYFTGKVRGAAGVKQDEMLGVRSDADKEATRTAAAVEAAGKTAAAVNRKVVNSPVEKSAPEVPYPFVLGASAPDRNGEDDADKVKKSPENGGFLRRPLICACFSDPEQIPRRNRRSAGNLIGNSVDKSVENSGKRGFDPEIVYLPLMKFDPKAANGVILPPVIPETKREKIRGMLKKLTDDCGTLYCLVGNIGHVSLCEGLPLILTPSYRFNITNSDSYRTSVLLIGEAGGVGAAPPPVLSPELTLPQIRDLPAPKSVIAYGRIPLMTLRREVGCPVLRDRRNVKFPLLSPDGHFGSSLMLNSVPVWTADRIEQLKKAGVSCLQFFFTTEDQAQVSEVLRAYSSALPPKGQVRRIKA